MKDRARDDAAAVAAEKAKEDPKALARQAKQWKVHKESIRPEGNIELRLIDSRAACRSRIVAYLTTSASKRKTWAVECQLVTQ